MDLELLTIGVSCEIKSAADAAKRPAFVVVCARLLTIGVFGEMPNELLTNKRFCEIQTPTVSFLGLVPVSLQKVGLGLLPEPPARRFFGILGRPKAQEMQHGQQTLGMALERQLRGLRHALAGQTWTNVARGSEQCGLHSFAELAKVFPTFPSAREK